MNLSIIIPLYNAEHFIALLLESIYNQPNENLKFEVIIIDDCSLDNSRVLIENFVQKFSVSNLKYVKLDCNQGTANARNMGLSVATGEWVQFVDSDDLLPNNYFEKIYFKLLKSNIDCYIYGVKYMYSDKLISHHPSIPIDKRMIGYKNVVVNKIYKRNVLDKFEIQYSFEDVIWLVKLMSKPLKCDVIEELYYPVNRQNINSKMANSNSEEWYKMAMDTISQSKRLNSDSRKFVLETFVGTILSDKFKFRHRVIVCFWTLLNNIYFLPFVSVHGIRKLDNKTIEYIKR